MTQSSQPDLAQAIQQQDVPRKIHTETIVQAVESAKAEADAAAQTAAIAEAETAFVPDAGACEVLIKTNTAKKDAAKAAVVEELAVTVIETEIKEREAKP